MKSQQEIFDSILVDEILSGNQMAFTLLFKRWQKRLLARALWLTGNADAAKDVVQESWEIIFLKLHQLKDTRKFGNWALSIVSRKCMDWLRKGSREKKLKSDYRDQSNISQPLTGKENIPNNIELIRRAIRELPKQQQLVLTLFYLDGFGLKHISEILNIPKGTVKSRLFNAREKLKKIIKK